MLLTADAADGIDPALAKAQIQQALSHLHQQQTQQASRNQTNGATERGSRGSTLGGKHLDGFKVFDAWCAQQLGLDADCFQPEIVVPGVMQRSKAWDSAMLVGDGEFLDQKELVVLTEYKSISCSYGRNFNNRVEEMVGAAISTRKAFQELAPDVPLMLRQIFVVVDDGSGELQRAPKPLSGSKVRGFSAKAPYDGLSMEQRFAKAWQAMHQPGVLWDQVLLLQCQQGSTNFVEPNPQLGLASSLKDLADFIAKARTV